MILQVYTMCEIRQGFFFAHIQCFTSNEGQTEVHFPRDHLPYDAGFVFVTQLQWKPEPFANFGYRRKARTADTRRGNNIQSPGVGTACKSILESLHVRVRFCLRSAAGRGSQLMYLHVSSQVLTSARRSVTLPAYASTNVVWLAMCIPHRGNSACGENRGSLKFNIRS